MSPIRGRREARCRDSGSPKAGLASVERQHDLVVRLPRLEQAVRGGRFGDRQDAWVLDARAPDASSGTVIGNASGARSGPGTDINAPYDATSGPPTSVTTRLASPVAATASVDRRGLRRRSRHPRRNESCRTPPPHWRRFAAETLDDRAIALRCGPDHTNAPGVRELHDDRAHGPRGAEDDGVSRQPPHGSRAACRPRHWRRGQEVPPLQPSSTPLAWGTRQRSPLVRRTRPERAAVQRHRRRPWRSPGRPRPRRSLQLRTRARRPVSAGNTFVGELPGADVQIGRADARCLDTDQRTSPTLGVGASTGCHCSTSGAPNSVITIALPSMSSC